MYRAFIAQLRAAPSFGGAPRPCESVLPPVPFLRPRCLQSRHYLVLPDQRGARSCGPGMRQYCDVGPVFRRDDSFGQCVHDHRMSGKLVFFMWSGLPSAQGLLVRGLRHLPCSRRFAADGAVQFLQVCTWFVLASRLGCAIISCHQALLSARRRSSSPHRLARSCLAASCGSWHQTVVVGWVLSSTSGIHRYWIQVFWSAAACRGSRLLHADISGKVFYQSLQFPNACGVMAA